MNLDEVDLVSINDMIQNEKDRHDEFVQDIERLINQYNMENTCDVADYLLAEMLYEFMIGIGPQIKKTIDWHTK